MNKDLTQVELDENENGEIFDSDYHEDYFDVDEIDEYGAGDDDAESAYLTKDLWDEDGFDGYEDWFEE